MELGRWTLSHEFVQDYLAAVRDELPVYDRCGLVPPVALAARALGVLLESLSLPPGAIHSLQEVTTAGPLHIGGEITGTADVGQPKRRGGLEFITATMALCDSEGREALRSKCTVLVTNNPAGSSSGNDSAEVVARPESTRTIDDATAVGDSCGDPKELPVVTKTITQEQLNAYARVSGDFNPLHLDAEFAATTQFGGIIAHGMLTLAFISEMLTAKFGASWLETGSLRVRFKGAAYVGDEVEAFGRVDKEEPDLQELSKRKLGCIVGVKNCQTGQYLISGTASVTV